MGGFFSIAGGIKGDTEKQTKVGQVRDSAHPDRFPVFAVCVFKFVGPVPALQGSKGTPKSRPK